MSQCIWENLEKLFSCCVLISDTDLPRLVGKERYIPHNDTGKPNLIKTRSFQDLKEADCFYFRLR